MTISLEVIDIEGYWISVSLNDLCICWNRPSLYDQII